MTAFRGKRESGKGLLPSGCSLPRCSPRRFVRPSLLACLLFVLVTRQVTELLGPVHRLGRGLLPAGRRCPVVARLLAQARVDT